MKRFLLEAQTPQLRQCLRDQQEQLHRKAGAWVGFYGSFEIADPENGLGGRQAAVQMWPGLAEWPHCCCSPGKTSFGATWQNHLQLWGSGKDQKQSRFGVLEDPF